MQTTLPTDLELNTGTENMTVLEEESRLSRSILWQMQRKFFENQGVEAWRRGIVPHYITSNPYIANAYANVVFGFLRDCCAVTDIHGKSVSPTIDPDQPIYIVELGAGSGRFAYHFLKKFSAIFRRSILRNVRVQYVMTDFAGRTVEYWRAHPALQPFLESGLLDFALFDAAQPHEINLISSGKVLAQGTVKNPMVVIANYCFDGIPQDSFSVREGSLYENIVSITAPQPEPDLGAPDLLKRVEIIYDSRPIQANYYDDPHFNQILEAYRQRLAETTFTFPIAAVQCIQHFNSLASGRLLLLSADKGYRHEEALLGLDDPGLNLHGSFSMMVNYHAMAEYSALQGGEALQTSYDHTSLCIAAFLFGRPPGSHVETGQAFNEAIEKNGPDDFFTLKKGLENHYDALSLEQLLSYVRLSGWDANIFLGAFPTLLSQLEDASPALHQELYRAVQHIWDLYYPLGEEGDLPFHLGMLLQAMAFYPEALQFYERSLQLYGPNSSTFYNMGMCHYNLRQLDTSLACMRQALEADPQFEAAKSMRIKLQSEIGSQGLRV